MTHRRHGEGGLSQRGDRWRSSLIDPRTGQRRQRTWPAGTTKRQAERLHREWQVELDQRGPTDRTVTLAAYLDAWVAIRKQDLTPATWHTYAAHARTLSKHLGHVRLAELDAMVITQTWGELSGLYAPATLQTIRKTLSVAMRDAVAWGRIHTSPVPASRMPRSPKKDRATPTTAQVHALCDSEPNPFWRSLWETLAGTGCRPGEALALRWADVDLEQRAITIARTITTDHAGGETIGDETKTRKPRKVTIDPHLTSVLAAWRAELAARNLADAAPQAMLWASADSQSGAVHSGTMRDAFRAAKQRAGVDPAVTPHAIRHWFVSTLVAAGVPAQTIATQTGHSIGEIHRRYGVHAPADQMLAVTQHLPAREVNR